MEYITRSLEHQPDVVSVSWGPSDMLGNPIVDPVLSLTILDAVRHHGVTVCVAAGNGGPVNTIAALKNAIAVGGTYSDARGVLRASSFASSGVAPLVNPTRSVPDICGLVGQAPYGVYIALPVDRGAKEDRLFAEDLGDGTGPFDGWLVASGTSSATPQVAGVVCLMVQARPSLRGHPDEIKQILLASTIDVVSGSSASGHAAAVGCDQATGAGLVNALGQFNYQEVSPKRINAGDQG